MKQSVQSNGGGRRNQPDHQHVLLPDNKGIDSVALREVLDAVTRCTYALDRKARVFVDRTGLWLAGNDAAHDFLRSSAAELFFDHGRLKASKKS